MLRSGCGRGIGSGWKRCWPIAIARRSMWRVVPTLLRMPVSKLRVRGHANAVVTLCHFLHILGWAGIADRTVWEGPEPVLCQVADEFDHFGNKPRMKVIQAGFASAGTRVIGFNVSLEGQ
jgi:hypothetical protein